MIDISEKNFEDTIEQALLAGGPDAGSVIEETSAEDQAGFGDFAPGGFHKRTQNDYDRELCLISRDVIDFIYATQPKEWEKLK